MTQTPSSEPIAMPTGDSTGAGNAASAAQVVFDMIDEFIDSVQHLNGLLES